MKTHLYKCFICNKPIVNSLEGGVCRDCFEEGLKEHSNIKSEIKVNWQKARLDSKSAN